MDEQTSLFTILIAYMGYQPNQRFQRLKAKSGGKIDELIDARVRLAHRMNTLRFFSHYEL